MPWCGDDGGRQKLMKEAGKEETEGQDCRINEGRQNLMKAREPPKPKSKWRSTP
jgi:hypothetical protein